MLEDLTDQSLFPTLDPNEVESFFNDLENQKKPQEENIIGISELNTLKNSIEQLFNPVAITIPEFLEGLRYFSIVDMSKIVDKIAEKQMMLSFYLMDFTNKMHSILKMPEFQLFLESYKTLLTSILKAEKI